MQNEIKRLTLWCGARVSLLALAGCLVAAGCAGPKDADQELKRAREQLERGDREAATRVMERALAAPALQGERPRLFEAWLQMLLTYGHTGEAVQALQALQAQAGDGELLTSGYPVLANHFGTNGQWQALQDCADGLRAQALPEELASRVILDGMRARIELGDLAGARVASAGLLTAAPGRDGQYMLRVLGDRLMRSGDLAGIEALKVDLRAAGVRWPEWSALAGVFDVAAAVAAQQWDAAVTHWQALAQLGVEAPARDALAGLLQALTVAGEHARVNQLCVDTLAMVPATSVQAEAAYRWLLQARRQGDVDGMVARLERVLQTALPPNFLVRLYREFVYDILRVERVDAAEAMLAMADRLMPKLDDAEARVALQYLQFDSAFMAEDYARVLELLDAGIENRDADWHAMARNKVLAHQALEGGNLDEAVARFQEFMNYVDRTWTKPETDPSSGLQYTREMALGMNARRIGDILLNQGATNRADVAFAEARDHYAGALQTLAPESGEYQHVTNELAQIPVPR